MKIFFLSNAKPVFIVMTTLFLSGTVFSQDLDKAAVQNMVNSKKFVFKAQTALPMSGSARQLSSDYDLRMMGDSIISYLPYYGRAYTSSYGEGGALNFTSTKFDYKVKGRKKGGWDVTVTPKDVKDVRQMTFTVSEAGYTSLQVTGDNRQPISFNGYLIEGKK